MISQCATDPCQGNTNTLRSNPNIMHAVRMILLATLLYVTCIDAAPHFSKPFFYRYGGTRPGFAVPQQQFSIQEQGSPETETIYVIVEEDSNDHPTSGQRPYMPQQPQRPYTRAPQHLQRPYVPEQPQTIYVYERPEQRPYVPQRPSAQTEPPPIITVSVIEAEPGSLDETEPQLQQYQPPQHRPQAPQYQPQAPQHRPQAPQYQPQAPQYQPPQHRPQAPHYQPQAPQYQPQAPQYQPQPPQDQPQPPQNQPQVSQDQPQSAPTQDEYQDYDAPATNNEESSDAQPELPSKPHHPPADAQPEYPEDNPPIDIRSGFSALPRVNPKKS